MTNAKPEEVQQWLEWAGKQLLALPVNGTKPQEFKSFWPDYPDDKHTAYGYTNDRLRPIPPSKDDIPLMDEILELILLISSIDSRRIVQLRCLVTPIGNRYLFNWSTLAYKFHTSRYLVRSWHQNGISEIVEKVDLSTIYRFRAIPHLTP